MTVPAAGGTATAAAASAVDPATTTASATPGLLTAFTLTPTPLVPTGPAAGSTGPVLHGLPVTVGRWRGEQVVNAAAIIKAGQAMRLDARTITIGVMTAMGESSLLVLDRGYLVGPDSRGLFQQRSNGAWGAPMPTG